MPTGGGMFRMGEKSIGIVVICDMSGFEGG